MPPMHLRRSLALAIGTILLAAPLSSCGFNLGTDRIYTPAAGTNDRSSSLDVLGAVIVSAEEGSGTFVATLVNNDLNNEATLESLEPGQSAGEEGERAVSIGEFSPITVPPGGLVNLAAEDRGIRVEGDFRAGQVVPLTLTVSGGDVLEMNVPVVPNCGEFEGIDGVGGTELCEVAPPVGGGH